MAGFEVSTEGNGYRARGWKNELQRLCDETGLEIAVCHFPPGTSKWNKIEHRLFCHITQNWRGRPLVSHETMVNLGRVHASAQAGRAEAAALATERHQPTLPAIRAARARKPRPAPLPSPALPSPGEAP